MFDPVGFVRAKIAMFRGRQAIERRIDTVFEQRAAIDRLRRRGVEHQLAEESRGYIELGRRDGGEHEDY